MESELKNLKKLITDTKKSIDSWLDSTDDQTDSIDDIIRKYQICAEPEWHGDYLSWAFCDEAGALDFSDYEMDDEEDLTPEQTEKFETAIANYVEDLQLLVDTADSIAATATTENDAISESFEWLKQNESPESPDTYYPYDVNAPESGWALDNDDKTDVKAIGTHAGFMGRHMHLQIFKIDNKFSFLWK